MTCSVVINIDRKRRVLLAYSLLCRNAKNTKTQVASCASFCSLAHFRGQAAAA
jgi:hypothetical protein